MSTGPKRAVTGDEVSFDLHQAISAPVSDGPPIEHAAAMLATTINVIQITIRRRTAGPPWNGSGHDDCPAAGGSRRGVAEPTDGRPRPHESGHRARPAVLRSGGTERLRSPRRGLAGEPGIDPRGRVTEGSSPRPYFGMEKIRLRRVVETGLRLAAVALLIGAVVMTGVGMFGVAAISGLNPEGAVKVLLVTLPRPWSG